MPNNHIDVSKGISHLQHLEDFVIVAGKEGADKAIDTLNKFVQTAKGESEDITISSKVDGSPSLFFGKDGEGRFFVSTKSIFNKEQKIGYSLADIQRLWTGELVKVLSFAFKYLKAAFKTRGLCGQGDVLFSNKGQKTFTEHEGQNYITFTPNVITYAVPVDKKSELYQDVSKASFGIVVHGAYETSTDEMGNVSLQRVTEKSVRAIVDEIDQDKNVFATHPYIDDLSPMQGSEDILNEIQDLISSLDSLIDSIDEDFNDAWREASDPIIKKAKKLLPQFINQQVRQSGGEETILTAKDEKRFMRIFPLKLKRFLSQKSSEAQSKLKTSAGRLRKEKEFEEFRSWFDDMSDTWEPLLRIFFRLYSIKNLIIALFDNVEDKLNNTFVVDRENDFQLKAVKPEGYVILNSPDMVKIVDRLEFSRNNMLYSRFNESTDVTGGTTGDPESIGDKKPLKGVRRFADVVAEEIFDALEAMENNFGELHDEDIVDKANQFKKYNAIVVGRMQPPTIAHVSNIANLSKIFKNVYVLLSDAKNKTPKYLQKNPLHVEDRKQLLLSDPKIRELRNVQIEGGFVQSAYGMNNEEAENDLRKLFDIPSNETMVLAIGKEDDRYFDIKRRGDFFDLNSGEEPSEETPHGLYGIDLIKAKGSKDKISASEVRRLIQDGEDEEAKEIMAGSLSEKEEVIDAIRNAESSNTKQREKLIASEKDLSLEELNVSGEILSEIEEDYRVSPEEAMDMIFDILDKRDE